MEEREKLAYLAGIIDGEGNLSLILPEGRRVPKAIIQVSNTDARLIEWLLENFDGRFAANFRNAPQKTCLTWRLAGEPAIRLVEEVLPYLVLKGEQAKILLSFWNLHETYNVRNGRRSPEVYVEESGVLCEAMKILNKKGK